MTADKILEKLYALLGNAVLLPIPLGEKGPQLAGWPTVIYQQTLERSYQQQLIETIGRRGNLGILLGPASNRLLALDLDHDALVDEWLSRHPWLCDTLRSKGRRGCQLWLRLEPDCPYPNGKAVFKLIRSGQELGELRLGGTGGAQSVIFGIHPAGMRYQVVVQKPPLVISLADLDALSAGFSLLTSL
jgi:Bifunctional DNA primase/polymerase, N-terminal